MTRKGVVLVCLLGLCLAVGCDQSAPPAPILPQHAVLAPRYTMHNGVERASGLGVALRWKLDQWPVVLTAHSAFGPMGGFESQIPTRQLPGQVRSVLFVDAYSADTVVAGGGPMVAVKDASSESPDKDLAIAWGAPSITAQALRLSDKHPTEGDFVWVALPSQDGPDRLHAAKVDSLQAATFKFRTEQELTTVGRMGAPVVDKRGQMVGMLTGCDAQVCTANGGWTIKALLEASLPPDGKPEQVVRKELAAALTLLRERDDKQGKKACPEGGTLMRWGADANGDGELQLTELFSAGPICNPSEKPYTFGFKLTTGKHSVLTTSTRTKRLPGVNEQDVMRLRSNNEVKAVKGGYSIDMTMTDVDVSRNGQDAPEAVMKMLEKMHLVVSIKPDGSFGAVTGMRESLKALMSKAPKLFKSMEAIFVTRQEQRWNQRMKALIGKEVRVGDVWVDKVTVKLPSERNGVILQATVVAAEVPCGSGRCLRLHQVEDSDRERLKQTLAQIVDKVPESIPSVERLRDGVEMSGEGERIIDPRTLDVHEDNMIRTFRVPTKAQASTGRLDVCVTVESRIQASY